MQRLILLTAIFVVANLPIASAETTRPSSAPASAQAPVPKPYLCSGYNPNRGDWDFVAERQTFPTDGNCAPGYAFLGIAFPIGTPRSGEHIDAAGRCCRLPDGVLTNEHRYEATECPDDFVATGIKSERPQAECNEDWRICAERWIEMKHFLRCTKIDVTRFTLGEKQRPYVLGFNQGLDSIGENFTTRSRIPLGLRYGLARGSQLSLDGGGYVGFPWGSVLTGKYSKAKYSFRQILFRDALNGDRTPRPLRVYPECLSVKNPLSPYPRCVGKDQVALTPYQEDAPFVDTVQRHFQRIYQWFFGQVIGAELLLKDKDATFDGILEGGPNKPRFSNAGELKKYLQVSILKTLEVLKSQFCQTEADGIHALTCVDGKSKVWDPSFQQEIKTLFDSLSPTASNDELENWLHRLEDRFRKAVDVHNTISIEDAEFRTLSSLEVLPQPVDIASIDARSAKIVTAILDVEEKLRIANNNRDKSTPN